MYKSNTTKRMKLLANWLLTVVLTLTCAVSFAQSPERVPQVLPNQPDEQVIAPVDFNALQPGTYVPGELIVGLDPAQPLSLATTVMGWVGSVSQIMPAVGIYHIRLTPTLQIADAAEFLRAMPGVLYVEPNAILRLAVRPNDALFGNQWAIPKIQADLAWGVWRPQRTTFIAIVDTGIDHDHPDLRNKIRRHSNGSVYGYNALNNSTNAFDDHPYGHGTHCAGIAAAEINNALGIAGVAAWSPAVPGSNGWVQLMPVKIFNAAGATTLDAVVRGIQWAADNGAHVISMSFGGPGEYQSVRAAVDYAWSRGLLLAAAAGNEGTRDRGYPAAYQNVIAVAATDSNDRLTSFTNYGSWVNIAAPGEGILSTLPRNQYGFYDGTSMACPFVAGAAALIWSHAPSLTNAQLRQALETNVDPYQPYEGRTIASGAGRLNVHRALLAVALPRLTNLTLSPSSVSGGNNATGTVTIDRAAPQGGFTVQLSSSNTNAATVPASITIPAGQSSATFTITTREICQQASVTITASANGGSRTATLTVNPVSVSLQALEISPTVVMGGQNAQGTVRLNRSTPCPITVQLSSNNTNAATVPASITIPAGQSSATFTITTREICQQASVTITASANGGSRTATLTVNPVSVSLQALEISPTVVTGGQNAQGTVRLNRSTPCPITVQLSSSNTNAATVPASITIPAGQSSATFTITTNAGLAATVAVTITATANGGSRSAQLTVTPSCVTIRSVTLEPTSWHVDHDQRQRALSGRSVRVTVQLNAPAISNMTIQLRSSDTSVAGNASLTIPAGQTTGSVTISTQRSPRNVDLRYTASNACSEVRSNTLRLHNTLITNFQVDPSTIQMGRSTWITVDIANPAPSGGYNLFFSHNAGDAFRLDQDRTVLPGLTQERFTASARQTHNGFILEVRGANGEVFRRQIRITR